MNTTKTVYNRLFNKKTELETHKIELGLIQDIKKNADNTEKAAKKFVSSRSKIKAEVKKAIDVAEVFTVENAKLRKSLESFKKTVEDLGLNARDNEVYSDADALLTKYSETFINQIKRQYKNLQ